jgi:Protein of unknown function (DUF2634)
MAIDDLGFELLPTDDEGLSPADELSAAVAGAVAEPDAIVPQAEEAPEPFGRTWVFDFERGQFVRSGGSPAPTAGFGAVQQWVLMVAHSARYAHSVFSDQFGMEGPDSPMGELSSAEIVADYEQHLREGVLVHERITALDKFTASVDETSGVLTIAYFEIVTDEEEVISFSDITLGEAA